MIKKLESYTLGELKNLAGIENKNFIKFATAVKEQELEYNSEIIQQLATVELYKRIKNKKTKQITKTSESISYFMPYSEKEIEYFLVLTLDGSNKVINLHEITKGTINSTIVHPREIFKKALEDNAVKIIVAHNHPSGSLEESLEDRTITKKLKKAGDMIGIKVIDHIIITKDGRYSTILI